MALPALWRGGQLPNAGGWAALGVGGARLRLAAAAAAMAGFAALAPGRGGQTPVLAEAALVVGHAGAALARDLALALLVHSGEAAASGFAVAASGFGHGRTPLILRR